MNLGPSWQIEAIALIASPTCEQRRELMTFLWKLTRTPAVLPSLTAFCSIQTTPHVAMSRQMLDPSYLRSIQQCPTNLEPASDR